MKVLITDFITSMKILHNSPPGDHVFYLGFDFGEKKQPYSWSNRCNFHTPEELEEGHRENPQLVTMPLKEFADAVEIELHVEDENKTIVAWPGTGASLFSSRFYDCCPAYTFIPEGCEGKMIEVEIDD